MKISRLKQKISREADLDKIWSFYMDHFADHPKFTDLGEPAQNDYLDAVIHRICQQLFGKAVKIDRFLLIHLENYQFFHGSFLVGGQIGGVIFFEDIKIGLFAMSGLPPSNEVKYSRFSEMTPMKPTNPSRYDLN
jgi:hypothetical protein